MSLIIFPQPLRCTVAASGPPMPEQVPLKDPHLVALVGDEQFNVFPYTQSALHSLFVQSRFPGHRPPGSNLGIAPAMETLLRESIPEGARAYFDGMINMGDVADVGSTEELEMYAKVLERLKEYDPRYRVLLFILGNHDLLHVGNFQDGNEFLRLPLKALCHAWVENCYRDDVAGPEVGGLEKLLDKDKLLDWVSRYFFGHATGTTGKISRKDDDYRVKPPLNSGSRASLAGVWREESEGTWGATLCSPSRTSPLQHCAAPTARRLAELTTPRKKVPIYVVALDTLDYLDYPVDGPAPDARHGRVSAIQVEATTRWMAEIRRKEPDALFILSGHYPVTEMVNVDGSGLGKLLSNPSIIAYVGAHTHWRGYEDLNGRFGIARHTALPQITVPSVIDFPNEMAVLRYGVEREDPERLFFEFRFTGLDPQKIPGTTPAVLREIDQLDLNAYDDAIARIPDPQLRGLVDPQASIGSQIGFVWRALYQQGLFNESVVSNDVIPAMIQDTDLLLQIFSAIARLNLNEFGQGDPKTQRLFQELRSFSDDCQSWLLQYRRKLANHAPQRDFLNDANLFANPHFRNLLQLVGDLPYGSQAHAFLTHLLLRSAKEEYDFYPQRQGQKKIRDTIWVRISTTSGKVTVSTPSLSTPLRYPTEVLEEFLPTNPPEDLNQKEMSLVLRGGISGGSGSSPVGGGFSLGYRRPLSPAGRFPRSLNLIAGFEFTGNSRSEGLARSSLLFSLPSHAVGIGPVLVGGGGNGKGGIVGGGGEVGLWNGLFTIQGTGRWSTREGADWRVTGELDFAELLRRLFTSEKPTVTFLQ